MLPSHEARQRHFSWSDSSHRPQGLLSSPQYMWLRRWFHLTHQYKYESGNTWIKDYINSIIILTFRPQTMSMLTPPHHFICYFDKKIVDWRYISTICTFCLVKCINAAKPRNYKKMYMMNSEALIRTKNTFIAIVVLLMQRKSQQRLQERRHKKKKDISRGAFVVFIYLGDN